MLIAEGHVLLLVAFVSVMLVSSVIALFTREASMEESIKPLVLSDEERQSLEAMALEARKRYQLDRKMARPGVRGAVSGLEE